MDFFSMFRRPRKNRKSRKQAGKHGHLAKKRPEFEPLEDRMLLSGNVISGYVFHDANNNGIFDAGESPIGNVNVELHNAQNQVVATAITNASGYYQFTNDQTINTNPQTITQTVTVPVTSAGFDISKVINQFNPNLGQLTEVDIVQNGSITSDIKVENFSTQTGATITGTVSGSITLSGGGVNLGSTVSNNAGTFNASAFDNTIDFGGTSGVDFNPQTATATTKSVALTGTDMNPFIGNGQVTFDEIVQVNSTASGGGNLIANITSTATATFTVIYKYKPGNPLQPGNYTIVEPNQPPLPNGPGNYIDGKISQSNVIIPHTPNVDVIPVTLTNQDVPNNDFGKLMPVSLSGHVYFDANNNGLIDGGESGIGGTTVSLTGTDYTGQSVSLSTTTAPDGSYGFINLLPGTYTITETSPAGWIDGKDTVGSLGGGVTQDQFSNIIAGSGASGTQYNFGELKPASLAGYVYNDVNNDGVMQAGEAGIGGVKVTLTGTDGSGAPVMLTTTTAADGSYAFTNLRAGTYTITETQPASGWLDGKDTIGTPGGNTSNDQFSNVVLGNGVQGVNNNFGELKPASLAGFVYLDANNNGVKDSGEQGIGGVALTLTGTDDNGLAVNTFATTAADGSYAFQNLRPGNYTITENPPAAYLDGKDSVGTQGGVLGNDQISAILLTQNTNGTQNNFAELLPGSLAGFVYDDANQNGVMDAGEKGIGVVMLTLSGVDDRGHAVSATTATAVDGSYSFGNLRPGSYTITETQPAGYQQGQSNVGSLGGFAGSDVLSGIAVQQSQHGLQYNFGEFKMGTLSGYVYHDANNNGVFGVGEQGIGGVTITLTGTTAAGAHITLQTTTAGDGSYSFTGLQPGTYNIQESSPAGWIDGKDTVGNVGGTMTQDNFANINLSEGTTGSNYNFGELKPGSISGFVYEDDNNNGIFDFNESALAGVTLNLTGTDFTGKAVSLQTQSAGDGSYQFANLVPGTYAVTETPPAGYLNGKDTVGSLGGTVSPNKLGNITVGDSAAGTNYNFGHQVLADLAIVKTVTPTTTLPGATLTYTLTISNLGPSTAQNVLVTDSLPTGVIFVSAAASGWNVSQVGNQLQFTESSMVAHTSTTIVITAVAPLTAGVYTNIATVTSTTPDPNLNNNRSTATVTVKTPPPSPQPPPGVCQVVIYSSSNWLALLKRR